MLDLTADPIALTAALVDVERYARNRADRPPAGTPAAHLYDLWLRLVCVLTRLAQQVAANSARLAGHAAFTTASDGAGRVAG